MKRKLIILILLLTALSLVGCDIIMRPAPTPTIVSGSVLTPEPQQITAIPIQTTQAPIDTPATELTMPPVETAPPNPDDPVNTMEFYSCYALMVSYNPANGWAEFDYFYMLTGQEAIEWLVSHEGYTLADAENEVNDYADGEYVCRNTNTGLRTIDLDTVPIKLMFQSDGTQVTNSVSIPATSADVTSVYNINSAYLFDYFFFYIHVDANGNVTLVEQIYWC